MSSSTRVSYQVVVDSDCCEGFGACTASAPQLFQLDPDTGLNVSGTFEIPAEQADHAIRAAAACPECAISVEVVQYRPTPGWTKPEMTG